MHDAIQATESPVTITVGARHLPVMLDDQLFDLVPAAVYVCDINGVVVRYNRKAGELWGRLPIPGDPKEIYCGSYKLFSADGEFMPRDQTPMVDALHHGKSFHNLEVLLEQPSGRKIWLLVNIDPLRNVAGDIVGVINCFQEITERKHAAERQNFLINELNHRVKNTLTTVQAIATYSFSNGVGNDAPKWFEGRLLALSRAHDVLTREHWEGASLPTILREAIAPMTGSSAYRFVILGPDVHLAPKLALSMSIAFHELCVNAAKYGALSNDTGQVDIRWRMNEAAAPATCRSVEISWTERHGPAVLPPGHRGFGTRVLERTLTREHDATVTLDFLPSGLQCTIVVPLL